MGTKLPLYGYVNLEAHHEPHHATQDHIIRGHDAIMAFVPRFLAYMAREDVQRERHFIIADNFDVERDPWTRGVTQEDDAENRAQFKQLLGRIDTNGSIIVPRLDDVVNPRNQSAIDVVDRILNEKIPVISIQHRDYSLTQFLDDNPVDASVFTHMVENSLRVRSQLERFIGNRDRILKAAHEFAGRPI